MCVALKITAGVERANGPAPKSFPEGSRSWLVTLKIADRSLTVPFYCEPGIKDAPDAADVLSCLLSDATSVENATDFEDWATENGYSADSREAERIYQACAMSIGSLRALLREHYDDLARAEH